MVMSMKTLALKPMTLELCHRYFREFRQDPELFADKSKFQPYIEPIGELILKNMDRKQKCCEMGICMKNDLSKGKGYGTAAEILALEYAFEELNLERVYADALIGNVRSRHVLQKAGFTETHRDEVFQYYVCSRNTWKRPDTSCRGPV